MELKEYFHQRYQGRDSFLENVIFPIFGEENFEDGYDEPLLESNPELQKMAAATGVASICRIGTIDIDFNPINIFDIHVSNHIQLGRNRVGVQQLVRRIMSTYSSAFMIFHYDDADVWDWRFTFCSKRGNNDEVTDNKRYTFLLGPGQSCRTAAENFTKLLKKQGDIELKDIESAFDVEALSNEFFEKYKQHYERFVEFITGKRFVKQSGKWVEKTQHEPHPEMYPAFGSDDKCVRDYVKKLLGRIVFLHFLQKKGWLGVPANGKWGEGDKQFMKNLFEHASEEQKADYLDTVLEPLFAEGLDKPCDGSLYDTKVALPYGSVVKVPYLNGGLFERDTLDEIDTRFPAEYFADLLEFLYQYNFTIDENDPNDAEVGVDPEMLGRIFENLLEDNKDKGAYYTPKEIVRYMCRESLVAYLTTQSINSGNTHPRQDVEKAIRQLLLTPEDIVPKMTEKHKAQFGNALREVRICDPAIGSGAFPMGLLSELVRLRVSIDAWAKDAAGNLLVDDYAALKREIVCDNIYGVDIERGAIDIARLRFWLSIVVDEHEPRPLPNLDYKFMQGNSLITTFAGEYVNLDTKEGRDNGLRNKMVDEKKKLLELKKQYYAASGNDKYKLEVAIKDSIQQLIALRVGSEIESWKHANVEQLTLEFGDTAKRLSYNDIKSSLPKEMQELMNVGKIVRARLHDESIPLHERAQTDIQFFDWRIMFTEVFSRPSGCNGFDIVIGNPPYGVSIKGEYRKAMVNTLGNVPDYEIYYYFINIAERLLVEGGILSYIIPNTWLFNTYARQYRTELLNTWGILEILDCSRFKIFESATVMNTINLFCKHSTDFVGYRSTTKSLSFSDLISQPHLSMSKDDILCMNQNWALAFRLSSDVIKVVNKIASIGAPLSSYFDTSQGLIAYDKYKGQSETIIKNRVFHFNEYHDGLKKCLWGEDVRRYSLEWNGKEWIDYCDRIANPRKPEYFIGKRLLVREITNPSIYAVITSEELYNDPAIIIVKDSDNYCLEIVLAIFNSKLASFYHFNHSPKAIKGAFPKILVQDIKEFPLPKYSCEIEKQIVPLVNSILAAKRENPSDDTSALEREIDRIVYQLYGLTDDEIKIIEQQ